jgi:hypothetical protein
MPARIVRATTVQNKRFIAIQHDNRTEYHVMLKAARDFNGQFIGYTAWLSKHNSLYLTEDEAVAAMLLAVDGIEGLAGITSPPNPLSREERGSRNDQVSRRVLTPPLLAGEGAGW